MNQAGENMAGFDGYGLMIGLALLILGTVEADEAYPLKRGEYDVGFKIVEGLDYSRPFKEKGSGSSADSRARVVRVSVWYPSEDSNGKALRFGDYLLSSIQPDQSATETTLQKSIVPLLEEYGVPAGQIDGKLRSLINLPVAASLDARASVGKFPLVIFCNGLNADAITYTVISEYLASHGYISIALPSRAPREGEKPPFDLRGIDMQMRDIEFAINLMQNFPNLNREKLALAAWSVGGVSTALLQMKNTDVDVLISFDGATGYQYGIEMLKQSNFYDPDRMNVPYVHMHGQKNRFDVPKNFSFYQSLSKHDAYLLNFVDLDHYHFTSIGNVLNWITAQDPVLISNFEIVNEYVLNFLNAYLKDDPSAKTKLSKGSGKVIISTNVERRS